MIKIVNFLSVFSEIPSTCLSCSTRASLIAEIVLKYFIKAFAFASPIPLIFVREVESVLFYVYYDDKK